MEKTLKLSNAVAFVLVLVVNYLANTGFFNNETMGSVSAQYENLFTPAGYAFSIWGLIYLGLAGFIYYQFSDSLRKKDSGNVIYEIGWWFVLTCIANVLWIITWLYDYTGISVLIMIILLFSLVKIILNTRMELDDPSLAKVALVWWPFSLYAGWISLALIANIAAYLTKIGWDGWGLSEVTWTIIMIIVAGLINLVITWTRNMREFALVGVWGLVAVAVANWQEYSAIVYPALITAGILFISSGIHAYKNRKYAPWRSR